jgi:hypothetical protein
VFEDVHSLCSRMCMIVQGLVYVLTDVNVCSRCECVQGSMEVGGHKCSVVVGCCG